MAGNNKSILQILGTLEKKNAPMSIKDLMNAVQLSQDGVYKACKRAIEAGYLSKTIKPIMIDGTTHQTSFYTRTDKIYEDFRAKTAAERKRKWQEQENKKRREERRRLTIEKKEFERQQQNFVPFRHPLDSALFGPWTRPVQQSTVPRRFIEQVVEIDQEEEACLTD